MMAALAKSRIVRLPVILSSRLRTCLILLNQKRIWLLPGLSQLSIWRPELYRLNTFGFLLIASIVSEFYIVVDKALRGENISTVIETKKYILGRNIFEFLEIYKEHKNIGGPGQWSILNGQLYLIGQ